MTAIAIIAATGFRVALNPVLGDTAPYAFQTVVLLAIAGLGGLGPSLFGLAVGLGLGWFVIPPYEQPLGQKLASEVFTASAGVIICAVTSTMRSALLTSLAAQREADCLSLEMHHRVKNLFAVVASMMTLAARDQPGARDVLLDLRTRLQSLADAHDVAINPTDFMSLPDLVDRLMAPHLMGGSGGPRVRTSGARIELPAGYTTPLGLVINELATNSVKHGALAKRTGSIRISWVRRGTMVDLTWKESGGTSNGPSLDIGAGGFGSLLLEASVAQLHGTIDRNMTDDGLVVRLTIPFAEEPQNRFLSDLTGARQKECDPPRSSLSALRGSRRFFLRRPRVRDSRS